MARHEEITIPDATWTQITNADVSSITFQNRSQSSIAYVNATAGEVAPSGVYGYAYGPLQGEYALPMSEGFPGVTGAARVWVYIDDGGEVFVSHA